MSLTTDPNNSDLGRGVDQEKVPQNKTYLVLSDEELAKGLVRPIRDSYVHKGRFYKKTVPMLEEHNEFLESIEREKGVKYVAIAEIEGSDGKYIGGRYITQEELNQHIKTGGYIGGCGVLTRMNMKIAETYARDPNFYGSTYCMGCQKHLPVGEFVWDGTNDIVGS
jgi:hypothetical protein